MTGFFYPKNKKEGEVRYVVTMSNIVFDVPASTTSVLDEHQKMNLIPLMQKVIGFFSLLNASL